MYPPRLMPAIASRGGASCFLSARRSWIACPNPSFERAGFADGHGGVPRIAAQRVKRQREEHDVEPELVQPAHRKRALLDEERAAAIPVDEDDRIARRARVVQKEARAGAPVRFVAEIVRADRRQRRLVGRRPGHVDDDAAVGQLPALLPLHRRRRRLGKERLAVLPVERDDVVQRRPPILDGRRHLAIEPEPHGAQDGGIDQPANSGRQAAASRHRGTLPAPREPAVDLRSLPGSHPRARFAAFTSPSAAPSACSAARPHRCRSAAAARSSAPDRAASPPTAPASPPCAGWQTAPGTCRAGIRSPGR